jgi:hypothetical protein
VLTSKGLPDFFNVEDQHVLASFLSQILRCRADSAFLRLLPHADEP